MFCEKYQQAFAHMGLTLAAEHRLDLASLGGVFDRVHAPPALVDYYATCGRHPINRRRNTLLDPDELYVRDGHLVFLVEEQEVALWGAAAGGPDPQVWQGNAVVGGADLVWFGEELPLSDFLIAMWRWELTGEEPVRG